MIKGAQPAPKIERGHQPAPSVDRALSDVHARHMQTVTAPKRAKNSRTKVPASDLVGVREIADRLNVRVTNVTTWINRRESNGFPEPVVQLAMGGVYDLVEVRAWRTGKVEAGQAEPGAQVPELVPA